MGRLVSCGGTEGSVIARSVNKGDGANEGNGVNEGDGANEGDSANEGDGANNGDMMWQCALGLDRR